MKLNTLTCCLFFFVCSAVFAVEPIRLEYQFELGREMTYLIEEEREQLSEIVGEPLTKFVTRETTVLQLVPRVEQADGMTLFDFEIEQDTEETIMTESSDGKGWDPIDQEQPELPLSGIEQPIRGTILVSKTGEVSEVKADLIRREKTSEGGAAEPPEMSIEMAMESARQSLGNSLRIVYPILNGREVEAGDTWKQDFNDEASAESEPEEPESGEIVHYVPEANIQYLGQVEENGRTFARLTFEVKGKYSVETEEETVQTLFTETIDKGSSEWLIDFNRGEIARAKYEMISHGDIVTEYGSISKAPELINIESNKLKSVTTIKLVKDYKSNR